MGINLLHRFSDAMQLCCALEVGTLFLKILLRIAIMAILLLLILSPIVARCIMWNISKAKNLMLSIFHNSNISTIPWLFILPPVIPKQLEPLQYEPPPPPAWECHKPLPPPEYPPPPSWCTIILGTSSPTAKPSHCPRGWPTVTTIHSSSTSPYPILSTWSTPLTMF